MQNQLKETSDNILIPKPLIDPYQVVKELNEAAAAKQHKFFRVFNTRSNKDVHTLHRGTISFLYRDPSFIEVVNTQKVIEVLFKMNDLIKRSNFLDYEIIPEEL